MENLMKKPLFAGSSEFAHNLKRGEKANLKVLGYCVRLTKAGKALGGALAPSGNLTTQQIEQYTKAATSAGIPVSGAKGCALYQLTAYENTKTKEQFINSFNPSVNAGEAIEVTAKPQLDAEGKEVTSANGTVYLRLEIAAAANPANNNSQLQDDKIEIPAGN